MCLCLRFFSVQINLQEFNHWVQQTAVRNRLKYSCQNCVCKHVLSIWGATQIRTCALSMNCYQIQLISNVTKTHNTINSVKWTYCLIYDRPMKKT
jgi:hypothetical protein